MNVMWLGGAKDGMVIDIPEGLKFVTVMSMTLAEAERLPEHLRPVEVPTEIWDVVPHESGTPRLVKRREP